jgi:hypothetical protein
MNKQRKTSHILNILQYDEITGAVTTSGSITAGSFIKSGGSSSHFLKADGSLDGNAYLTTATASLIYQTIITNPVTGTGTTNFLPKFTSSSSIGNSIVYDGGSSIGINTTFPFEPTQFKLDVNGGVIIKNTSGTAAQLILIDSNPATGGNNGFVQLTAGGNTGTAFGQWQTFYGTSIASGTL